MQILVAKADELTGRALCAALEKQGVWCRFALGGAGMIAALQSEKFDGVVFDLLMHEISGDEAWRLAEEMFETLPPAVALSQTPVRDIPLLCTRLKIGDCINAAASAEQILERLISVQARNGAFETPSSRASA